MSPERSPNSLHPRFGRDAAIDENAAPQAVKMAARQQGSCHEKNIAVLPFLGYDCALAQRAVTPGTKPLTTTSRTTTQRAVQLHHVRVGQQPARIQPPPAATSFLRPCSLPPPPKHQGKQRQRRSVLRRLSQWPYYRRTLTSIPSGTSSRHSKVDCMKREEAKPPAGPERTRARYGAMLFSNTCHPPRGKLEKRITSFDAPRSPLDQYREQSGF